MRRDIEFDAEGLSLRGRLYLPDGPQPPVPTVVMGRGYSCVKEMFLDAYARTFVAAGLGVLVYDNPDVGNSDGTPREDVDPWGQIRDYRHAITYACSLPEVDGGRIGIWGTSHTGGHVLVVGAIDNRVKCVVSQVPVVSSWSAGEAPQTVAYVDKIGVARLLMIVEDNDTLAAVARARDIYDRALEPKKLVSFSGEHFDASVRDQEAAAAAALDWYLQHLSRPRANVMTEGISQHQTVPARRPHRDGRLGIEMLRNDAGLG
jgi:dienelactone hydrolase